MSPNRLERRRRGLEKSGMSNVEFQAFLKGEREKQELIFRPRRLAQSVLFALRYPERKLA